MEEDNVHPLLKAWRWWKIKTTLEKKLMGKKVEHCQKEEWDT